ncbi:MAG: thiamine diphosphokinase, partial [Syntrophothermus sp.]
MQRIVIFANGELPDLNQARLLLHEADMLICADGGTSHALALAIKPDLIIGDLDSADAQALHTFKDAGVDIASYPRDKNETDLELAINRAIELAPQQIIIIAALGGRLDQTLANITLLSDPRLSNFDVRLDDGVEEVMLCREQVEVRGRIGDLVSLIPWQGAARGVRTSGLKWALHSETLYP